MAELDATTTGQKVLFSLVSLLLICVSGLVAGLTLGLLSLDRVELEVVRRSGNAKARRSAARVIPLLRNPHMLLVSLVLLNAGANTALPVFLDRLVSPAVAIVLATSAVLIFGEILPQAVCAKHGIAVGSALSWVVKGIMILTSPISWPLGRALDWILGGRDEGNLGRRQLKARITLHAKEEGLGGNLMEDEIKIIRGVLDLAGKDAADAMTPLERVFALPHDAVLDRRCLAAVLRTGLSRVPVWRRSPRGHPEFVGFLLVKEVLQQVDPSSGVRAGDAPMRPLPHLSASMSVFDLLKFFCSGRSHIAVLTAPENEVADIRRSLAGPASTISTRGSDESTINSDDSSSSSSSSSSSGSSVRGSRRAPFGRTSRSTVGGGSTPRRGAHDAAAEPALGLGSRRGWRVAEHRIRAVLRLLAGGRTHRHARPDVEAAGAQQQPGGEGGAAAGEGGGGGIERNAAAAGGALLLQSEERPGHMTEGVAASEVLSRTAAAALKRDSASVHGAGAQDVVRVPVLDSGAGPLAGPPPAGVRGVQMIGLSHAEAAPEPAPPPPLVLPLPQLTSLLALQPQPQPPASSRPSARAQLQGLRAYGPQHLFSSAAAHGDGLTLAPHPDGTPGARRATTATGAAGAVLGDRSTAAAAAPAGPHPLAPVCDQPAAGAGAPRIRLQVEEGEEVQGATAAAVAAGEELIPVGIITLEDVLEELMQFEITDETDPAIRADGPAP